MLIESVSYKDHFNVSEKINRDCSLHIFSTHLVVNDDVIYPQCRLLGPNLDLWTFIAHKTQVC